MIGWCGERDGATGELRQGMSQLLLIKSFVRLVDDHEVKEEMGIVGNQRYHADSGMLEKALVRAQ